jgi:hypothetical protein
MPEMMRASDLFLHPDNIGESEYRAVYDLVDGVLADMDDEEESYSDEQKLAHASAILNAFIDSAESMKRRLKQFKHQRSLQ